MVEPKEQEQRQEVVYRVCPGVVHDQIELYAVFFLVIVHQTLSKFILVI